MKTYHQYQSESKIAEQKLRTIQQQLAKIKSVKKQKAMGKRVEKVYIKDLGIYQNEKGGGIRI
jgi:hypothetical protein